MKVTVIRTGGFAGIERRGEADTTDDPVLSRLVEHVDLTAALPPAPAAPDRFSYEIGFGGRQTVVGEGQLTGELRELIHHVLDST